LICQNLNKVTSELFAQIQAGMKSLKSRDCESKS